MSATDILNVKAGIPQNEKARLEQLRRLRILDTLQEPEYDDLVEAASALFNTPMALVTLVDSDRQWFKASVGVEICQTSRDAAFCAHALLQTEPLVVPDALLDERFSDNPLVTGEPYIRFYVGAPIVVEEYAMGTLCCIDVVPREPDPRQVSALAALARQVAALFCTRLEADRLSESERQLSIALRTAERAEETAKQAATRFEQLFSGLPVACYTYDGDGAIQEWNSAAESLWGLSAHEAFLKPVCELTAGFESKELVRAAAGRVFAGETVEGLERREITRDGRERWVMSKTIPLRDAGGAIVGGICANVDLTEQREQERRIGEQLRQISAYSIELEVANARLESLATTDGLTGVKNHRFFQDYLRRKIDQCQAARIPLTIALVDVDHFKAYNDDFGHQAGDEVLRNFASTLSQSCREQDLVARYGGEEFVVVMPGLGEAEAAAVAERMRAAVLAQPFINRSITASFGVASLGRQLRDAADLVGAADGALYRSKSNGRNRVSLWADGADVASESLK